MTASKKVLECYSSIFYRKNGQSVIDTAGDLGREKDHLQVGRPKTKRQVASYSLETYTINIFIAKAEADIADWK